jgi:membrane-bound ClpP family serine protease
MLRIDRFEQREKNVPGDAIVKGLRGIPRRAAIRYALLQIPSIVLVLVVLYYLDRIAPVPSHVKAVIIAMVVLSDIAMLPLLWRAYDTRPAAGPLSMVGERGVALRELSPEGLVLVRGEIWRARVGDGHAPVAKGGVVTVVEREGLVLTVEPGENSGR